MDTLPTVLLKRGEADRIVAGHPWVYHSSIERLTTRAANGAVTSNQVSYGKWGVVPWPDYSAIDDFAEIWWDPSAQGKDIATYQPGVGKYRYLNGGKRYALGQWPDGEPKMFDTAGTALWYTDYPPGDRPPSYPCPSDCPSKHAGG